jgi:outer membrane scaffolding protein for murein synthesis (MipA/OmpV family)
LQILDCRAAVLAAALLLPLALAAQTAGASADDAAGRPLWEVGVVAGGGVFSDYPGSDQSHRRGLLAPLVLYRGPILRVDQEGVRGRLLNSEDFEFDLSASAAFNARENDARRGMPDLDYLFGVGPQLVYKGLRGLPGSPTVHVKANAVFSTDFSDLHHRGGTLETELRWRLRGIAGIPGSQLTLGVEPTWASRALQAYFYEVAPAYATAERPAYGARAGYFGTGFKAAYSQRLSESTSWFLAARTMALHGAANRESPLMRRDTSFGVVAGIVWTPWRSETRVGAD